MQRLLADARRLLIVVPAGETLRPIGQLHPVSGHSLGAEKNFVIAIRVGAELSIVEGGAQALGLTSQPHLYRKTGVGRTRQVAVNTITVALADCRRMVAGIRVIAEHFLVSIDERSEKGSRRVRLEPHLQRMQQRM